LVTQESVTQPTVEPTEVITQDAVAQPATEPSGVITQEAITEPKAEPTEFNTQEAVTQPTTEPSQVITQEAITQPATAVAKGGASTGILAGLAALAAAAAAGSSSSSSSSTSTSTAASGTLYYTEYTAQYGLASINALTLNDAGYTGSGVKLAIVDTGINSSHSEFSGRTISGYDFSTGTGGYSSDVHGHGTHVASIAAGNRDAMGMRGVAYDATLYSYKLLDDSGSATMTDALYASIFNRHVTDSIKVSNNSWGTPAQITSYTSAYFTTYRPLMTAAAQSAVTAGTIFVWAAGNSSTTTSRVANPIMEAGLPYYVSGLSGQWLAVVAVDSSNVEAYYTNRCGVAATWCVTAPGSSIYAAQSSGTYVTYSGTSMAAPHVSGVLATLIQAFPALTPAQVVTRLTSTASLSGLTAYDRCTLATCGTAAMSVIFGYGLINSTAAMARIGSSWVLPSGKNYYSDGTYVANASSAVLPAGLPSSATQAIKDRDFVVFDSFDGANFTIKGAELFGQNTSVKQSNLRYAPSSNGSATARSSKADFASVNTLPGTDLKFGFAESQQGSIAGNLSFWGDKAFMMPTMDSGNPMQRNYAGEFSLPFGEKSAVNYFYELSQDGKLNAHGFGFTQTVFKKLELNFSAGIANDQSYALGYRSDAVVSNVYSTPMKIGAKYPVSDSWEIYGYASSRGVSDLDPTNRSWGLSKGTYSAYSVGAEWKREGGDRFVAGLYQPESLANGSLSLVVPAGRKTDGTILWKREMFDVNEQVDPGLFLAGKMPINWGSQNKPELRFQMQTNPQNNHSVDKASIDLSWAF
jgi:subtilase-type serine protease